jgi:GNAT superfamily N-acetyltransferase
MKDLILKTYKGANLKEGGKILISNRLYTPSKGCIRHNVMNQLVDIIILAYDKDKAIACILRDKFGDVKIIDGNSDLYRYINVWVKPKYRKQGIGALLVSSMKRISRKKVVGHSTDDGQYFYPKMGILDIPYK